MDGVVFAGLLVAAAPPLLFAVLGETLCERAGVVNLGLDGMLVLSAMSGFAAACSTGIWAVGFLAGALTGVLVALVLACATLTLRQSQFAVGFVLTLLCRDLAYVLGRGFEHRTGPQVESSWMACASLLAVAGVWCLLYRSQAGLRLRGLGENPRACHARGLKVIRLRYLWIALGGALVGLGGATVTLCIKGWSRPDPIAGKGWIALAIVIFGGWHPVRVALGVYLFVALEYAAVRWQDALPSGIPSQLLTCLPFPMMILALLLVTLAGAEGTQRGLARLPLGLRTALQAVLGLFKATPPAALGQEFRPE